MRIDNKKVVEKLRRILTEERIQLLKYIKNNAPCSLNELAQQMKKDYGNLYRSIKVLEKAKLLKLKTVNQSKIPKVLVDKIELVFKM